MRFILLLVWSLLALTAAYYATAITHIITPILGKDVTFPKLLIPFYGWIKLFKH